MPKPVGNWLLLELTSSLGEFEQAMDLAAPQISDGFESSAFTDGKDVATGSPPAGLQSLHQPVRNPGEQWFAGLVHAQEYLIAFSQSLPQVEGGNVGDSQSCVN